MSKKLSGAQRRKLNKESELAREVLMTKVPKLTNFFHPSTSSANQSEFEVGEVPLPSSLVTDENITVSSPAVDNDQQVLLTLSNTDNVSSKIDSCDFETLTDPASWPEFITMQQLDEIVLRGPAESIKEDHEFPKNSQNRHFSKQFKYRFAENGEKIIRRWLIYSEKSDSSYCFCCRLFDPNSKSQFGQTLGFNDWKHMAERLKSHEVTSSHFKCMVKWFEVEKRLKEGMSINQELINQIRTEAHRSEEVLRRLVEIILYLSENNIAFRGTSAKLYTQNNGNFLGLVQLLGKFDAVLMEHLRRISDRETHFHLLSVSIQNELINILGNSVKQSIIKKIQVAKYFSVIFDCTPDISHREQTSLTIRYVNEDPDDGEINVEESFIAYRVAGETTGEALAELMFKEIAECGLSMTNCRGQGYDNGANMAGIHKGVQARVRTDFPLAFFVPCGCHSLNLVIADGAKSSVKSTSLFGILQRLFTMFSGSTKRWCVISDHIKNLTIKQVCETRWEARINAVQAVRYQYVEVRDALLELSDNSDDPKIASEAQSLVSHMEDFSFIVCLLVWHDLLFEVNLVSKSLQGKSSDIGDAIRQFNKCLNFLTQFRNSGYVSSIISAKEIAEELQVEPTFKEVRHRKKKRISLYESDEQTTSTPEETFKREVFYPLVDTVSTSLNKRSSSINEHQLKWGFLLNVSQLPEKEDLKKCCMELESALLDPSGVSDINGNELYHELLHVKSILDIKYQQQNTSISPKEVLNCIKKTKSKDLFTNLWVALRVFLTIPVTVATAERSFSKLKLIKTYLRSTMAQERLNSLAMLSIENEEAKKIDFKEVLSTFAHAKARRMPF